MKILNVIETENGIISKVVSFLIENKKQEKKQIKRANVLFVKLAKANGLEKEDVEDALDNENFQCNNGYEISIISSDKIKR